MFKCSCHRMKCDRGADAWNKFAEITHQCFLTSLGRHVPLKINMGFAKVWRKNFFLAKMAFFTWKNLEQPSYLIWFNARSVWRRARLRDFVAWHTWTWHPGREGSPPKKREVKEENSLSPSLLGCEIVDTMDPFFCTWEGLNLQAGHKHQYQV